VCDFVCFNMQMYLKNRNNGVLYLLTFTVQLNCESANESAYGSSIVAFFDCSKFGFCIMLTMYMYMTT